MTTTVTCVYCGHSYPDQTPTHGSEILTDHIRVCPKHPLRKAEADITLLRSALITLVGDSDPRVLNLMKAACEPVVSSQPNAKSAIIAINALLATGREEDVE